MRLGQLRFATRVFILLSVTMLLALNQVKLQVLRHVGAQYPSDARSLKIQSLHSPDPSSKSAGPGPVQLLSPCPFHFQDSSSNQIRSPMIPDSDPKFDPEPWSACIPPRPKSRKTAFIGVWSSAKDFNRRALIRLTYLRNKPTDLDVYFVLGRPETDQEQTLVALEMAAYHDILLLNMTENLTEGKTFEFFRTVGVTFKPGDYAFVTKMDSDVWCELPQFTTQLQRLLYQQKSMGTYFGRAIGDFFMAGMGYTLSWDLVRWIAKDAYPASHRDGFEDQLVADWLHHSGLLVHFVSEETGIYDTPEYAGHGDGGWAQNYTDPTLIVHQLKSDEWFLRTAKYFLGRVG